MREGPLSDLFRSTGADAPEDPPEAPRPGRGPRYGREDPAEARKAEDAAAPVEQPQAEAPVSAPGEAGTLPEPGSSPYSANTVSSTPATGI